MNVLDNDDKIAIGGDVEREREREDMYNGSTCGGPIAAILIKGHGSFFHSFIQHLMDYCFVRF